MTDAFVDSGVLPSSALSCDYCGWMQRFDGNGSPENLSRAASVRGWAVSVHVGFSHMTLCPYLYDHAGCVGHLGPRSRDSYLRRERYRDRRPP